MGFDRRHSLWSVRSRVAGSGRKFLGGRIEETELRLHLRSGLAKVAECLVTTEPTDLGTASGADLPQAPVRETVSWRVINLWLVAGLAMVFILYRDLFGWLWQSWGSNPDYSHGYFVPVFAAYILWSTRSALRVPSNLVAAGATQSAGLGTLKDSAPIRSDSGSDGEPQSTDLGARLQGNSGLFLGALLIACGLLMRMAGIYVRVQTLEAVSLLPFILGVLAIVLGRPAIRWGAPAILFLLFMIPLPSGLAGALSGLLQSVATQVSTYALQTLGVPAFAEGNVISLSNGQIGVAEACSGLRMLYAFFALTVGACIVIDRPWYEKVLIASTAVPIAILANCIRIVITGLAFEHFDPETAQRIFHDAAGWLMMPLGFAFLMGVLAILDRLIVPEDRFPFPSVLR